MPAQHILRSCIATLLIALATAFPAFSYAASAANVDFSVGNVMAVDATGVQRPLTKGDALDSGDSVRTGDGGRVQMRFSDGAMVSLQPQTDFRIDDYRYSGKADGQEKGFFSLLKGGFRTITGWVGRTNREKYRVTTTVATIGIRGTEYTAVLNTSGDTLTVATGKGLVEVCNIAGCILLPGGESAVVQLDGPPRREHSPPRLPYAPPPFPASSQPVYGSGDQVNSKGLPVVGRPNPVTTPPVSPPPVTTPPVTTPPVTTPPVTTPPVTTPPVTTPPVTTPPVTTPPVTTPPVTTPPVTTPPVTRVPANTIPATVPTTARPAQPIN